MQTGLTELGATKPHYQILDGLRGVAAVMVIIFHFFELHAPDRYGQIVNHGYMAVDFFFVLSGFVIAYAYDDRWNRMSVWQFMKRRLIRLHPMVLMGMIVGAILFYAADSSICPLIHDVSVGKMLLFMLLGMLMIPAPPSMDIRGWNEMYTLDAPVWSLFYEYIGNILYALFVRKFSNTALLILVIIAACANVHLTLSTNGDVIGGWIFKAEHLHFGMVRLIYPFFAGVLLYRIGKLIRVRNAFLWCSLLIVVALAFPRIGGSEHLWMNGLYESFCIIFVFPLIVYIGASGTLSGKLSSKICKFLGDISFPLYITHYPLIYLYARWVTNSDGPFANNFFNAALLFVIAIAIAYASLKLYDEPVRKWLSKRFNR